MDTNFTLGVSEMIGTSDKMQLLFNKIDKVAKTDTSVLLYGETGTGKDMVARRIHSLSSRAKYPFVARNCSALPSNLVESLLFGTSRGSYTGAEDSIGVFEAANNGTVFLDEINSMSTELQAKLLRVLENKRVVRVGETIYRPINVRIITAMNENPQKCIRDNLLRPDIYYRLAGVQLYLPPLRERRKDIPLLVNFYIGKYNEIMGKNIKDISPEVKKIFSRYQWPGNIRELRNIIEGSMNFADGRYITPEDLPDYIKEDQYEDSDEYVLSKVISDNPDMCLNDYMAICEKAYISKKMEDFDSLSDLAYYLGISKQTLNYKLKKYGLGTKSKK